MSTRFSKRLLAFFFSACISVIASAQSTDEDSAKQIVTAADTTAFVSDEDDADTEIADTIVSSAVIYFPKDSLRRLMQIKEFQEMRNIDSVLEQWQKEQLAKSKLKKTSVGGIITFFQILRLLFWVVIIAAVVYLIYRLFLSEKGLFAAPVRNKKTVFEEDDITDEDVLAKRITDAERAGNYRVAVRYYFLSALNAMARRNWILLSPDKTNYQYLRELSGKKIRNDFARIALHYEYAWYGNFEVSHEIYQTIKKEFISFQSKIK